MIILYSFKETIFPMCLLAQMCCVCVWDGVEGVDEMGPQVQKND